jgi:amino acid transporter, AAT family
MFGALFTWLMIFVTHLFFRHKHPGPLAFRMWGYPYTSILGAAALLAILITSLFTREFRMTLVYGVPFLIALTIAYHVWLRGSRRGHGSA